MEQQDELSVAGKQEGGDFKEEAIYLKMPLKNEK